MGKDIHSIKANFQTYIGAIQVKYANLSKEQQEDIADFQAGLLAVFNKTPQNQKLSEFLKEIGLPDSLYAIRTRDMLDKAKKHAGVIEADVAEARIVVDSKEGLDRDIPPYNKVGVTLEHIPAVSENPCMSAQAYIRALESVEKTEEFLATRPKSNHPEETQTFYAGLLTHLQKNLAFAKFDDKKFGENDIVSKVVKKAVYSRVNVNKDDAEEVKLSQITMVLADVYATVTQKEILFQSNFTLDEGLRNDFKQVIAKGMERVITEFEDVGFKQAATDLLTIKETISFDENPRAAQNIYSEMTIGMRIKAFENAAALSEKLEGFAKTGVKASQQFKL